MRAENSYNKKTVRIRALARSSVIIPTMGNRESSSIQTHPSLLQRLVRKDGESWNEFYRIYGRLVRDFAMKAGLTETEADEVVQETAIAIARHLPEYHYNREVCRFKTWLLNQASWRIKDQFRKRRTATNRIVDPVKPKDGEESSRTAAIDRVPDPASLDLDALFEAEWRNNLFASALESIKQKFSLKQIQIFDLLVIKEWPAKEVAQCLGITLANAYVTRHRISAAIEKEIKRLEAELEKAAGANARHCPTERT